MPKARKERLDELLAARGLAESRAQARLLILAGKVRSGTQVLDKPGKTYPDDLRVGGSAASALRQPRGREAAGLPRRPPLPVEGLLALDVGASTEASRTAFCSTGPRT
jgi:23S rRNA (cytidine1920-2'-O)/16S rRNA (cytidine1409-2'-O)-methyltransferase